MRSDHASRAQADDRLGLASPDRLGAIGASASLKPLSAHRVRRWASPAASSGRLRRFDAAALAAADRLVLALLHGVCALIAVLAVHASEGFSDAAWPQWRLWAVLFPTVMVLMPVRIHSRFEQGGLSDVLQFIGLLLKSVTVLLALQLPLWAAGLQPLPASVWVALLAAQLLLCHVARWLLLRLTRHWKRTVRIVVVGADEQGIAMAEHLQANAADVDIVGFVDDRRSRVDLSALPAPFLGAASDFVQHDRDVDGVVIALPNNAAERVETLVATLRADLMNIYLAPETPVLRRAMVKRQAGGLETMMLLGMDRLPLQGRIPKRLFDIAFASTALLLFLPIGLVIAALIKLESPGPVIFRQRRYGLGNRLFDVYKFRSMRFEPAAPVGEIRLTQRDDSRVTKIGAFLRRTSLDEFPQFFNVLMGEMSVVGPRPHPPGVKAGERVYEDVVADFMERYKVRPGITGWAQVNGLRGNTFTEGHLTRRFAYDIQYIRNWSLELDLWIVLKTVWGGFGGHNAF